MKKIKSVLKLGGKVLLVALVLQLFFAGSAFAFFNVDTGGGSSWHQDGSQGGTDWWDVDMDDKSSGFNGWGEPEEDDRWWDW